MLSDLSKLSLVFGGVQRHKRVNGWLSQGERKWKRGGGAEILRKSFGRKREKDGGEHHSCQSGCRTNGINAKNKR